MNVERIPSNQWQIIWVPIGIVEMYFTGLNCWLPMLNWLEKPGKIRLKSSFLVRLVVSFDNSVYSFEMAKGCICNVKGHLKGTKGPCCLKQIQLCLMAQGPWKYNYVSWRYNPYCLSFAEKWKGTLFRVYLDDLVLWIGWSYKRSEGLHNSVFEVFHSSSVFQMVLHGSVSFGFHTFHWIQKWSE